MNQKRLLVYGVLSDALVLLPEHVAKAFAEDHEKISKLRTYGEARRFEPQTMNSGPGLDEDDYDEVPVDDQPYSVTSTACS
jgi:hypothetical protein